MTPDIIAGICITLGAILIISTFFVKTSSARKANIAFLGAAVAAIGTIVNFFLAH